MTRILFEQGSTDISSSPPAASEQAEKGYVLALDAFVRSIGVQRSPFALFLGAGASTTSGIPSAEMCIWEWKRQIFLTNNPGLEDQFAELSLEGVRRKIQHWLDRQGGYPREHASEEYKFYIKRCFPITSDRSAFFQQKVRDAHPHVGYRLLCHLAENATANNDQGKRPSAWLTALAAERGQWSPIGARKVVAHYDCCVREAGRSGCGSPPVSESQVRTGLYAGGSRIRTVGLPGYDDRSPSGSNLVGSAEENFPL